MVCVRLALVALVLASCAFHSGALSVTPVQKVLQMMTEMKAKGEKMMDEEQKTYRAYTEWVDDQSTQLGFEIKTAKSDIEELLAFIAKADSDVASLSDSISELETEIAGLEKEKADATALRTEEHAEYVKVSTDYGESVDALGRAIQTLQAKDYDVPQAEAMLQKMAKAIPGMRRVFAEFLQSTDTAEQQKGGPAVAAYEFQSGGIIELLKKFLKKFKGELEEVESAESNQAHAYDQEMLHLTDTISYSNKQLEEKSILKAKRAAESAKAKGNLADTKEDLAEDEKTLADTQATYETKTAQYKENQKVRADELEAIAKAIEIISDPSVSSSYGKHINLAQTTFLQVRSAKSRVNARNRAAALLQKRGKMLNSQQLSSLAEQLSANPFDKVVKMIEDLLAKLKEEAAAEADHKAWCDEQLHDNKIKREKKTSKVNKLTAEVDGLTEDIAEMGAKIKTLAAEQVALGKAMTEATELRTKEKAENTQTMADAKAGEDATKQALVVLKEFYASQSFLQRQVPEMAAYKGMQSAKGGVVGMLEVISSDFARLYSETKAAEDMAASEYDTFMTDSKTSKKEKHDLEYKTSLEKDQSEFEKEQVIKDLKATQKELDMALEYQQYLKPICLEIKVSYAERVARREEEIKALKEAYEILDQK
jgi:chromosome segregation ATPase